MKINFNQGLLLIMLPVIWLLVACTGDDGIEGSAEKPTPKIVGTAATDKPLANALIQVRAKDGSSQTVTTSATGEYAVNVTDKAGPFLMMTSENGRVLYTVAADAGTTHLHPLTDLVVRNWFSVKGYDVEQEFARAGGARVLPSVVEINAIKTALTNILQTSFADFDMPGDFDLFASGFDVNSQGFTDYLAHLDITLKYNKISVVLSQPVLNAQTTLIQRVNLDTDFTTVDTNAPSNPDNVQILRGSLGLVAIWNSATDNRGVAGYKVFRNGSLIGNTSFPFYSDTELPTMPTNGYCYQVQAFDGAGGTSAIVPVPEPVLATISLQIPLVHQNPRRQRWSLKERTHLA